MLIFKSNKRKLLRESKSTYKIYYNACGNDGVLRTHQNEKKRISKHSAVATYKRMIVNMDWSAKYDRIKEKSYQIRIFLVSPTDNIIAFKDL